MTDSASLPRKVLIFGMVLPVAALLGFLMATPDDVFAVAGVALVLVVLAMPFVLKWHHPILIFSMNAAVVLAFLPGSPHLWMLMGLVSGAVTLLGRILDKNRRLINVPSVTWPLVAFGLVVLLTAQATGGMGSRAMGSGIYGGKKYFFVWLSIVVYFAISWQGTIMSRASTFVSGYLLSGVTSILSNVVYLAGPAAWIFYYFIPVDMAMHQILEDFTGGPGGDRFGRLGGVAVASYSVVPFLTLRYGVRGLLDFGRPWRIIALVATVIVGTLGGFRSTVVFAGILFVIQFVCEGLHRTRMFPALVVIGVLGMATLVPTARFLPLAVQRSLSILPIPVSEVARFDAEQSSRWRLEMWSMIQPDIPRYLWLGKGFTASSTDYYLTQEMVRRQAARDQELMILAGDYHSGPLSVLIPFGVWGALTFLWFLLAGLRVVYRNFRHGDPRLRSLNTFLLSFFLAKLLFFLAVFGAVHLDILTFVAIVGLSVSINGGIRRPEQDSVAGSSAATIPDSVPARA